MRLKEARAAGEMFYTGKVCRKHKELKGHRRAANGNCPGCIRDRMKQYKKKGGTALRKHRKEYRSRMRAAMKAGTWSPRQYRKANEKATSAIARADGQ
jgi:hypothetical protein